MKRILVEKAKRHLRNIVSYSTIFDKRDKASKIRDQIMRVLEDNFGQVVCDESCGYFSDYWQRTINVFSLGGVNISKLNKQDISQYASEIEDCINEDLHYSVSVVDAIGHYQHDIDDKTIVIVKFAGCIEINIHT